MENNGEQSQHIGINIQRARKELGWTQEELAQKMGYKTKSSINKIEKGVNDIPQRMIVRFAKVLGTTPGALMGSVSEETGKKNSAIAGAVKRMRTDETFLAAVEKLMKLDPEKLKSVDQLLAAMIQ